MDEAALHTRIAQYREQAAKLREWAERSTAAEIRDSILKTAADYDRLADGIGRTLG